MTDPLDNLVRASQRGDIDAFGLVVERFQRMACAVAYAVIGDVHLAEDAAQEAFIEAYQCLASLREPAAFPAWFRRIVLKRADRLVRGKQLDLLPIDAISAIPADQPSPAQISEAHELRRMLLDSIAALPDSDRLLVSLFHLGGYSQREVAAIAELSEPIVKKRLFRARQTLRRLIVERVPDLFQEQLSERGVFARAVQFFIAVRASDHLQVRRMLDTFPELIDEHERWDEEQARRSRLPAVGSFTALHRAVYHGDPELVDLLLARGADPSAATKIGQTPLHLAVLVDHPPLVVRLLASGADPNAQTERGQTPLHWAVIRSRAWHIDQLVAAGAADDVRDAEGRTPRDWAAIRGIDLYSLQKEHHHV